MDCELVPVKEVTMYASSFDGLYLSEGTGIQGGNAVSDNNYYASFDDSPQYGAGLGFTIPAVQAAHQRFVSAPYNQTSGYVLPPEPPRSVLYDQAATGMGRTNLLNMQQRMLQKMQPTQEEKVTNTGKASDSVAVKEKQPKQETEKSTNEDSQDDQLKDKMKQLFIDELMRRQEDSGTFDITEGTIKELTTYEAGDPVIGFYNKTGATDLEGEPWNCEADCEYLRSAMKGLGTDEDAIIHVVTTRCNAQRQQISKLFKTMYGRDIVEDIHSELSGDFREAVMACFVPPPTFDAWSIKEAIYGLGTDEQSLIEILMTRTNEQLKEMKQVYPQVASPNRNASESLLDKDIADDTSGDFKRLLRSAANAGRVMVSRDQLEKAVEEVVVKRTPTGMFKVNYEKLVDMEKCKREAQELFAAGEDRWGTDEETFIRVFAVRNYYELRMIWCQYVKISQRDILNSIDRETSGDFKKGLASVVMNIRCRAMYFAERLKACMKGLGTADKDLIRIIVSRSEIDMVQIKQCFLELTKQTLWLWLRDDCSGDYRKLLQGIVGRD